MIKKSCLIKSYWLLAGILFSLAVVSSVPGANIRLGKLAVEPGLSYQGEYNDNVFLEKENKESDFIHTVSPSVVLKYQGRPGNYFSTGYRMKLTSYSDFHGNNHQMHNPFVSFGIKTPAGFYSKADAQYIHTADPYGTDSQYGEGEKTKRWSNTIRLLLGYQFAGRYGIEGAYQHGVQRFYADADKWQNRSDHQYGFTFFYKITQKTSLLAQYRRTQANYGAQNDGIWQNGILAWSDETSQDYTLNDYFIGLQFRPGGKVSGEIKLGYGEKKFDNHSDMNGSAYKDESSWVAEADIHYHPTQKTLLSWRLKRAYKGSSDTDASSYLDTLVGLYLKQRFSDRLSFGLGLDWNRSDYAGASLASSGDKYFNTYTVRTSFEWVVLKWLIGGIEYRYRVKHAGDAAYGDEEYKNSIFLIRLSTRF